MKTDLSLEIKKLQGKVKEQELEIKRLKRKTKIGGFLTFWLLSKEEGSI